MIVHVNKNQPIHRALYDLKKALGITQLDHWEYQLDHTDTHWVLDVNENGLPPYRLDEDLFIWKMKYQ